MSTSLDTTLALPFPLDFCRALNIATLCAIAAASSTVDEWVPAGVVVIAEGAKSVRETLMHCTYVSLPQRRYYSTIRPTARLLSILISCSVAGSAPERRG